MSGKAFSDTLRQVRKARIELSELEDDVFDYLEEKCELKEELQDLVREILDNIDAFDDASTVETMLSACCKKAAPSRGHRRNAGKKTKEEVIQTVKERRGGSSSTSTPPSVAAEEAVV